MAAEGDSDDNDDVCDLGRISESFKDTSPQQLECRACMTDDGSVVESPVDGGAEVEAEPQSEQTVVGGNAQKAACLQQSGDDPNGDQVNDQLKLGRLRGNEQESSAVDSMSEQAQVHAMRESFEKIERGFRDQLSFDMFSDNSPELEGVPQLGKIISEAGGALVVSGTVFEVVARHPILVRTGNKSDSVENSEQLRPGALIKLEDFSDDCIRYTLLRGFGPTAGWVTSKYIGKDLIRSSKMVAAEVEQRRPGDAEQVTENNETLEGSRTRVRPQAQASVGGVKDKGTAGVRQRGETGKEREGRHGRQEAALCKAPDFDVVRDWELKLSLEQDAGPHVSAAGEECGGQEDDLRIVEEERAAGKRLMKRIEEAAKAEMLVLQAAEEERRREEEQRRNDVIWQEQEAGVRVYKSLVSANTYEPEILNWGEITHRAQSAWVADGQLYVVQKTGKVAITKWGDLWNGRQERWDIFGPNRPVIAAWIVDGFFYAVMSEGGVAVIEWGSPWDPKSALQDWGKIFQGPVHGAWVHERRLHVVKDDGKVAVTRWGEDWDGSTEDWSVVLSGCVKMAVFYDGNVYVLKYAAPASS